MKLSDKIILIAGFICTLLMLWHAFTPVRLHIDEFKGLPCIFCCAMMGYAIAHGREVTKR